MPGRIMIGRINDIRSKRQSRHGPILPQLITRYCPSLAGRRSRYFPTDLERPIVARACHLSNKQRATRNQKLISGGCSSGRPSMNGTLKGSRRRVNGQDLGQRRNKKTIVWLCVVCNFKNGVVQWSKWHEKTKLEAKLCAEGAFGF